ncbi:MAG: hypothetical protein QOF17_1367 [Solirubrobacteraceae bacterium]|nr:hypothetical protein [Solirubrobacteraceae bacterium]
MARRPHHYRATLPLLAPAITVVVPDLRRFGDSDRHRVDPAAGYSATAQARSIAGLIAELGLYGIRSGGAAARLRPTSARSCRDGHQLISTVDSMAPAMAPKIRREGASGAVQAATRPR